MLSTNLIHRHISILAHINHLSAFDMLNRSVNHTVYELIFNSSIDKSILRDKDQRHLDGTTILYLQNKTSNELIHHSHNTLVRR